MWTGSWEDFHLQGIRHPGRTTQIGALLPESADVMNVDKDTLHPTNSQLRMNRSCEVVEASKPCTVTPPNYAEDIIQAARGNACCDLAPPRHTIELRRRNTGTPIATRTTTAVRMIAHRLTTRDSTFIG